MSDKKSNFEKQGASWYVDRYESARVERNRYFILLVICLIALIASVLANLMLSPLKTAVPYVVEINKVDGATTVLRPVTSDSIKQNRAVTIYFLQKYLQARESYDYGLRQLNADIVRGLSTTQVYRAYTQLVDANNPKSPVRKYRNEVTVNAKIIGIAFPYEDIAQINFYTEVNNPQAPQSSHAKTRRYWQATIKFTYANIPVSTEDRMNINPLGFFVTDYEVNEQVLPNQGDTQ